MKTSKHGEAGEARWTGVGAGADEDAGCGAWEMSGVFEGGIFAS